MLQDNLKALQTQLDAQAQMISSLVKDVDEIKYDVSILSSRLTQTNADLNNKLEDLHTPDIKEPTYENLSPAQKQEADNSYMYYIVSTKEGLLLASTNYKDKQDGFSTAYFGQVNVCKQSKSMKVSDLHIKGDK